MIIQQIRLATGASLSISQHIRISETVKVGTYFDHLKLAIANFK